MILAVCLNPAIDKISEVCFYPVEKVKKVKNTVYCAGGKGINIARVMKTLGADTLTIGFSGGYTGRFFKSLLKDEGIKARFVNTKGLTRVNSTMLEPNSGKETHFVEPGPAVTPKEVKNFRRLFTDILDGKHIDCVIFSGSLPRGVEENFYSALIKTARKKGIRTALDTRGKPLKKGIGAKPDIIKPNKDELEELAGAELKTNAEIINFAKALKISETIVTMGRKGALLAAENYALKAVPLKAAPTSSVGSGDALLAGYIFSRILKGAGPEDALIYGSACAAANLDSPLPGEISLKAVNRYKSETKIKRAVY